MGRNVKTNSEYLIGDVLLKMLDETHLTDAYRARSIARWWNSAMGPLARYTLKVELQGDTLYVTVVSPIVKQELRLLQNEILQKLQQQAGAGYVKKLVIK